MRGVRKVLVNLLVLAGPLFASAATQDATGTVGSHAAGAVGIAMPEISGLDCGGMRDALARLDRTRYRGLEPVAEDDARHDLFLYEDRLAAAYYYRCTLAESHRAADAGFGTGFRAR